MDRRWSRRAVLGSLGTAATAGTLCSLTSAGRSATGTTENERYPISQRVGSTHVAPDYTFTDHNVLNEGAKRLQELGSEVIKIWFHYLDEKYPQHSDWPSSFDSLVEQANHEYLRELFERPFKTYILSTYSRRPGNYNHYFREGVSTAQYQQEVEEFYELSKHLLEAYRGSGKEFVLQHWQGDWAIIGSYDSSQEPTDEAVAGMIRWLNARQEGVTKARQEVESDVAVLHATEINIVLPAMLDGERRVVNAVLPETNVDLVSHNSYDEMHLGYVPGNPNNDEERGVMAGRHYQYEPVTPPEQVELMYETLDYVNRQAPEPSAYARDVLSNPEKNVFVGEYGFPSQTKGMKQSARLSKVMTDVALDWGARWVLYWQLYDNEETGYWLIRSDGTKTPTYRYFRKLIETNRVPTPPTYVELQFEFDRLVDDRAFACAELAFQKPGSGESHAFDLGTPMKEPVIWDGTFWTHENGDRTWRWFGGNDGLTRIFVPQQALAEAETLRLHGHPRETDIEATLRVNGETTDAIQFSENRWRDWSLSLAPKSTRQRTVTETTTTAEKDTTTTRRTTTATTSDPSRVTETSPTTSLRNQSTVSATTETGQSATSVTDPPNSGDTPGFGPLAALTGLGSIGYKLVRDRPTDRN